MTDGTGPAGRDWLGELFERALALPPEERAAFLEEECGGEEDLHAELTSLLASHDAAPNFLERIGARIGQPPIDRDRLQSRGERLLVAPQVR